ncbi:MAG: hypothetical protein KatS3mg108_2544 [Isosphaeraceae bacterium]|jgi:hypothetical protein|nr:MAG: hypothetical protein KatS3mg108_2544 [Isosphaeraceae bacterium]
MAPRSSRRRFLAGSAAGLLAASAVPVAARSSTTARRPVALIGTVDYKHSHAQHFLDRLLRGYAWQGGWRTPDVELVSFYIDQFPDNDLARARSQRHKLPLYPTIAEALTRGTSKLAVDGVLIIGEHGNYPRNEKGQTLYPRYEFFKQVVAVFESSGRSVPVFNDKHLSTDWSECLAMVETARRLGFPFLAGSSLPVTWRLPSIDMPYGADLKESLCAGYGAVDSYDFHGLETAQCMSERRRGGEVGIRSVQALRGPAMWDRIATSESTARLLVAALCRSQSLPAQDGYNVEPIHFEAARRQFPDAYAYFIEHRDGFKTTLVMLPIHDFNYAGLLADGSILSCQMYLPMPGRASSTADFFNPLIRHIETMITENHAPYPVERTLLTSGMTLAAVDSLHQAGAVVPTPDMAVTYQAPRQSLFWRD